MSKLGEQNVTRDSIIFEVTYDYRAQLPRPTDWAGETDVSQPIRYESGVTRRVLHVLAPSEALATASIDGSIIKDFVLVSVQPFEYQLDWVITKRWGGR